MMRHPTYREPYHGVQRRTEERQQRDAHSLAARGSPQAWLRDWQADRGTLGGKADLRAPHALPDAPPPRKPRVDQGPLGREAGRAPAMLLPAHPGGTPTAGRAA